MNSPLSSNTWIGRLIGDNQRYRLDKSLGRGGMGEVFLATDTRVGKQVALKLLKDKWLASGEMQKRFEREIAICAALQSDHIIEISDCGVSSEGFPFYVMEYLRGQTLGYLMLREKQLSPERTVKIMAQVCIGLQLAHQGIVMQRDSKKNGSRIKVIHRDLKPDNIFLLPTEFGERVKILDFGIAKIHHNSSEQTNLTKTFIGTFRYSSPEQIQNDKNIDPRSDIYSLGIILYEILSAADPFGLSLDGSKVSETSWLNAHSYRDPIPLKQQPGCEQLSSELEAVVLRCLQKNPNRRFASVEVLSQALQAAILPAKSTTYIEPKKVNVQPKSQQPQLSSNNETVPKSQLGSNDETVYKPQQPPLENHYNKPDTKSSQQPPISNLQGQTPEGTIFQRPPISNLQGQTPEGTIFQRPPASNPQQKTPEGTIFQRPPASNPQQKTPEGTIYQPRTPTGADPKPEKTIYQPRSGSNPDQQQPVDGTIMQSPHEAINSGTPEKTIFQPRPDSPPIINNVEPQKNNLLVLRILGITLALLLFSVISYFIINQYNNEKVPQTEKNQSLL